MPKPRFFRSLLAAAVVLIAVPLLLGAGGSSGGLSDDLSPDLADLSEPAVSFAPKGHKVLPESKLLVDSALGIDLTNQSITLPLHKGEFRGKRVWYIITEASDFGVANGLDVNFSPKLVNMAVGCPRCVQEVTLEGPPKNKFGEAVVQFQGVPDFSPRRELVPGPAAGPGASPPASATPGAVGDARYSPLIRIRGSSVIYNTAIVASGDGPFDVERHTNTADRVLSIKKPGPAEAGKFSTPTVEMLLVRVAWRPTRPSSTSAPKPPSARRQRSSARPSCRCSRGRPSWEVTTSLERPASGSSSSPTARAVRATPRLRGSAT